MISLRSELRHKLLTYFYTNRIAYEAMIKGSLALMLSHGQRPHKQFGHHIANIEFAQKNLPGCPAGTFALFDHMRRKRNDAFYDSVNLKSFI